MDSTQRLLACSFLHTAALNTDPNSCPLEAKPLPMKTIYTAVEFVNPGAEIFIQHTPWDRHQNTKERFGEEYG